MARGGGPVALRLNGPQRRLTCWALLWSALLSKDGGGCRRPAGRIAAHQIVE
jgi:hypothetical protein